MAEKKNVTLEYSPTSLNNAIEIANYLRNKFSEKEVEKFYQFLLDFEHIIVKFPTLYNASKKKKIRRAVLSKELSVFYLFTKSKISIVAIIDNRWDQKRILK